MTQTQSPTSTASKLPWILVAVLMFVLVTTMVGRPVPTQEPAPQPTLSQVDTQIYTEHSPNGVGMGPSVWRDQHGSVVAVMDVVRPHNYETVWCVLDVDGQVVEMTGTDGNPAICMWVRGGIS